MSIDLRPHELPDAEPPARGERRRARARRRWRERSRGSLITWIATTAARRWRITMGLLVIATLSGLYAFGVGLDREGLPPVNTPISVVTGTYFVDDAERVDDEVVAELVAAFVGVDDVQEVLSEVQPSSFAVVVEGVAVSEAVSVREDGTSAELWVHTDPSHRRRGYARQAASAWLGSVAGRRLIPFYSHERDNVASRSLAEALRIRLVYTLSAYE